MVALKVCAYGNKDLGSIRHIILTEGKPVEDLSPVLIGIRIVDICVWEWGLVVREES